MESTGYRGPFGRLCPERALRLVEFTLSERSESKGSLRVNLSESKGKDPHIPKNFMGFFPPEADPPLAGATTAQNDNLDVRHLSVTAE